MKTRWHLQKHEQSLHIRGHGKKQVLKTGYVLPEVEDPRHATVDAVTTYKGFETIRSMPSSREWPPIGARHRVEVDAARLITPVEVTEHHPTFEVDEQHQMKLR